METEAVIIQEPVSTKIHVKEDLEGVVLDHSSMEVDKLNLTTFLDDEITSRDRKTDIIPGETDAPKIVNGSGKQESADSEREKDEPKSLNTNKEDEKIISSDMALEKEKEKVSVEKPVTEEDQTETKHSPEQEEEIPKVLIDTDIESSAYEEIPIKNNDEVIEVKDSRTVETSRNSETIANETFLEEETVTNGGSILDIETNKSGLLDAVKEEPRLNAIEEVEKETLKTVLEDSKIVSNEETTVHEPMEAIKNSENTKKISNEVDADREKKEVQESPIVIETLTIKGEDIESKASLKPKEEVDQSSKDTEGHEQVLERDIPKCETLEAEAEDTSTVQEAATVKNLEININETETVYNVISGEEEGPETKEDTETIHGVKEGKETEETEIKDESHGREESVEVKFKETVQDDITEEKHENLLDVQSTETEKHQDNEPEIALVGNKEIRETFEEASSDVAFKVDKEVINDEKIEAEQIGLDSNESEAEQIGRNRTDETEKSIVEKLVVLPDDESVEHMEKLSIVSPSEVSEETSKTVDEKIEEKPEEEKVTLPQEDQVSLPIVQEKEALLQKEQTEKHAPTSEEVIEVSSASLSKELEGETVVEAEKIEEVKANEEEHAEEDKIKKSLETVEPHNSSPSSLEEKEHETVSEKTKEEKAMEEEEPMVQTKSEEDITQSQERQDGFSTTIETKETVSVEESIEVKSKENVQDETPEEKHKNLFDVQSTETEKCQDKEAEKALVANTESRENSKEVPSDLALRINKEDQVDGTQTTEEIIVEKVVVLPDVESVEPSLASLSQVSEETSKTVDKKIKGKPKEEEEVTLLQEGQVEGSYGLETAVKAEKIEDMKAIGEEEEEEEEKIKKSLEKVELHSSFPSSLEEKEHLETKETTFVQEEQTREIGISLTEKCFMDQTQTEQQVKEACSKNDAEEETATNGESLHDVETTAHESIRCKVSDHQDEKAESVEAMKISDDAEHISSEVTEDREKKEDIIQKPEEIEESTRIIETPTIQGEETESKASLELKGDVDQSSKLIEEHVHVLERDITDCETLESEAIDTSTVQETKEDKETSLNLKEDIKQKEEETVKSVIFTNEVRHSHQDDAQEEELSEHIEPCSSEIKGESQGREESVEIKSKETVQEESAEKDENLLDVQSRESETYQDKKQDTSLVLTTESQTKFVDIPSDITTMEEKSVEVTHHQEGHEKSSCVLDTKQETVSVQDRSEHGDKAKEEDSYSLIEEGKHEPTKEEVPHVQQNLVEEKSDEVIQVLSASPSEKREGETVVEVEKIKDIKENEEEQVTNKICRSLDSFDQAEPQSSLPLSSEEQEHMIVDEAKKTEEGEVTEAEPKGDMSKKGLEIANKRDEEITMGLGSSCASKTSENVCTNQEEYENHEAPKLEESKEDKSHEVIETTEAAESSSDQTLPIETIQEEQSPLSELVSEQEDQISRKGVEIHREETKEAHMLQEEEKRTETTESTKAIEATSDQTLEEIHGEETKEPHKLQEEERGLEFNDQDRADENEERLVEKLVDVGGDGLDETTNQTLLDAESNEKIQKPSLESSSEISEETSKTVDEKIEEVTPHQEAPREGSYGLDTKEETVSVQDEKESCLLKEEERETKLPKEQIEKHEEEQVADKIHRSLESFEIAEPSMSSSSKEQEHVIIDESKKTEDEEATEAKPVGDMSEKGLEIAKKGDEDVTVSLDSTCALKTSQNVCTNQEEYENFEAPKLEESKEEKRQEMFETTKATESSSDQTLPLETIQAKHTPRSELVLEQDDQILRKGVEILEEETKNDLQVAVDQILEAETSKADETPCLVSELDDQIPMKVEDIHEVETKEAKKLQDEEIFPIETVLLKEEKSKEITENVEAMEATGDQIPKQVETHEEETKEPHKLQEEVILTKSVPKESVNEALVSMLLASGEHEPVTPKEDTIDTQEERPGSAETEEKEPETKPRESCDFLSASSSLMSSETDIQEPATTATKVEDETNQEEESKGDKSQDILETKEAIKVSEVHEEETKETQKLETAVDQTLSLVTEHDDKTSKKVEEIHEGEHKLQAQETLHTETIPTKPLSEAPVFVLASNEDKQVTLQEGHCGSDTQEEQHVSEETKPEESEGDRTEAKLTKVEDESSTEHGDESSSTLPVVEILKGLQTTLESERQINDLTSPGEAITMEPIENVQKRSDVETESNEKDSAAEEIIEANMLQQNESEETEKIQKENGLTGKCHPTKELNLTEEEDKEDVKVQDSISREFVQEENKEIAEKKQEEREAQQDASHETVKEEDQIVDIKQLKKSEDVQDEKLGGISAEEKLSSEVKNDQEDDASELRVGQVEKEEEPHNVLKNDDDNESNQEHVEPQAISNDAKSKNDMDFQTEQASKDHREEVHADKSLTKEAPGEQIQVSSIVLSHENVQVQDQLKDFEASVTDKETYEQEKKSNDLMYKKEDTIKHGVSIEEKNNVSEKIDREATKEIYQEESKQTETVTTIKEEETTQECFKTMKNIDDTVDKTQPETRETENLSSVNIAQDKPKQEEAKEPSSDEAPKTIEEEEEEDAKEPSRKSPSDLIQKVKGTSKTEDETTETRIEEETKTKEEDEDGDDKTSQDDSIVMVEARDSTVSIIKTQPKKSQGILSGVGSKVKHSISKVKKVLTGKSSHTTKPTSPK